MQSPSVYVVTGATKGIGRAVAIELAERRKHVIAVGRSTDLLLSLQSVTGPHLTIVEADLATEQGIELVADSTIANSEIGRNEIAGIVHSAGSLVPLEPYDQLKPSEMIEHLRIHVATPISLYQALARHNKVRRMLFVDSYSASAARRGWPAYSIVKAAAQMAARCADAELPETRSIRVFPGAVNTQIVESVLASDTETASVFAGMLERGEFSEPSEVAEFLVALLVDATDGFLDARESFDYNNAVDRSDVLAARRAE